MRKKTFLKTLLFTICASYNLCATHAPAEIIQVVMHVSKAEHTFAGAKNASFSLIKESGIAQSMKIEFETSRGIFSKELEVDTILYDPCGCERIFSRETIQNGPRFFISLDDRTSCECHEHACWHVNIRSGVGWWAEDDSTLELIGMPD